MPKLILFDCAIATHKSIFNRGQTIKLIKEGKLPKNTFCPPTSYIYMGMIISALKKVGVAHDDMIIFGLEDKSWRKDICATYKAQRKEYRDSFEHINWKEQYEEINKINEQLNQSTPFYFIRIPKCEFDDIASVSCRFFKDKDIVIVSGDSDLEQLCYYPNVKIFSLWQKYKGVKGAYKEVKNPLKIIHDKVTKGDIGDNILIDKNNDTPEDAQLWKDLVSLLELPDFIENPVLEVLQTIGPKTYDESKLPFPNSLAKKFYDIYDPIHTITFDDMLAYQEGKEKRKKNKVKKEREAKKVSLR